MQEWKWMNTYYGMWQVYIWWAVKTVLIWYVVVVGDCLIGSNNVWWTNNSDRILWIGLSQPGQSCGVFCRLRIIFPQVLVVTCTTTIELELWDRAQDISSLLSWLLHTLRDIFKGVCWVGVDALRNTHIKYMSCNWNVLHHNPSMRP